MQANIKNKLFAEKSKQKIALEIKTATFGDFYRPLLRAVLLCNQSRRKKNAR